MQNLNDEMTSIKKLCVCDDLYFLQNGSVSCCHQLITCKNAAKLVNMTDFSGKTAVHFAAAAGHSKVIQELYKVEGCDLEIEDPDERYFNDNDFDLL